MGSVPRLLPDATFLAVALGEEGYGRRRLQHVQAPNRELGNGRLVARREQDGEAERREHVQGGSERQARLDVVQQHKGGGRWLTFRWTQASTQGSLAQFDSILRVHDAGRILWRQRRVPFGEQLVVERGQAVETDAAVGTQPGDAARKGALLAGENVERFEGEGGLAYPRHPLHCCREADATALAHVVAQVRQLLLAADEPSHPIGQVEGDATGLCLPSPVL